MKGLIPKTLALLCCAGGLTATSGCFRRGDLWDPCWPQRYSYQARQEVLEGLAGQVSNGHVLDQTVWEYHFKYDYEKRVATDELTPGGLEHLKYLARRRPCPDPTVYLQTAQDVLYDPAAPEKYVEARLELNARRTAAIQKFLTAYTAGGHVAFNVVCHDPAEVGMHAIPMGLAIQRSWAASQGVLPTSGGAGGASATGGGGAP